MSCGEAVHLTPRPGARAPALLLLLILLAPVLLWPRAALPASAPEAPPGDPLLSLYASGAPLWFEGTRLGAGGRALLGEMQHAERRGLDPLDYRADELLRDAERLSAPAGAEARLAIDRAISVAALRFLQHLERGRIDPAQAGYLIPLPPARPDREATLRGIARGGDVARVLDRFEPPFLHFALLKRALARYRELEARKDLPALPPLPARKLSEGDRWTGVPALRRRLAALGDLPAAVAADPPAADAERYDAALATAVRAFQRRHGLAQDGVIGAGTFKALNVPFAQRVNQLLWSMERARWLPPPTGPFILVNIPQYRLFAFSGPEDREAAMTPMNVIVGRAFPEHNTPIFTAQMRYLVLRPYWDVPASIARKELVPSLRKEPGYAARHGYELVRGQRDDSPVVPVTPASIDELARGALRIRQRPGPENALGAIKFMLPNRYNVYLHSTPAQALFARSRRDYSHGCVRVEDPLALAGFVLGEGSAWTRERLSSEMQAGGGPLRVDLPRPITVLMVYATALAVEDGRVLFFEDVYGHDARLGTLLEQRLDSRKT